MPPPVVTATNPGPPKQTPMPAQPMPNPNNKPQQPAHLAEANQYQAYALNINDIHLRSGTTLPTLKPPRITEISDPPHEEPTTPIVPTEHMPITDTLPQPQPQALMPPLVVTATNPGPLKQTPMPAQPMPNPNNKPQQPAHLAEANQYQAYALNINDIHLRSGTTLPTLKPPRITEISDPPHEEPTTPIVPTEHMPITDTAAAEFLRTLSEGEATVWGLTVVTTENRIAEVTGLPAVGENFSSDAAAARAEGSPEFDPRSRKRQCPSPAAPSPAAVSPTATPVAISSSSSSFGRAKPSKQTKKRKTTGTPPAVASAPRRNVSENAAQSSIVPEVEQVVEE
ncbi:myosin-1-like [Cryptomeria japonica]|uniref:myosin-1-like n=1 Tax=Cryptomeria japonica TaxID=3369 RepID=UPI0027D9ED66|nr:myosin-1-like [Cryptomeria japonica]